MAKHPRSITSQLIAQSADAALTAVQVFNNPLLRFKSETFIVLMNIAWTYLLHAFFRRERVEYRYFRYEGKRRRFERINGKGFRYWELSKCLNVMECPLDNETKKNLLFLIGLRDVITHYMSPVLDDYVSARYQACCLNYNHYAKKIFGDRYGIDHLLSVSLQFQRISRDQLKAPTEADLPASLRSYIAAFDQDLSAEELNSERFAFRLMFAQKLVGKAGQADEVVQFYKPDSETAQLLNQIAIKEVEKPQFLPSQIVRMMREEGYSWFTMQTHTDLWRALDAKTPEQRWGCTVANTWYWYSGWVERVRDHCRDRESSAKNG